MVFVDFQVNKMVAERFCNDAFDQAFDRKTFDKSRIYRWFNRWFNRSMNILLVVCDGVDRRVLH